MNTIKINIKKLISIRQSHIDNKKYIQSTTCYDFMVDCINDIQHRILFPTIYLSNHLNSKASERGYTKREIIEGLNKMFK